ncbi:unnamed protein product, partial [Rotaria sp. Silwood1]
RSRTNNFHKNKNKRFNSSNRNNQQKDNYDAKQFKFTKEMGEIIGHALGVAWKAAH